MGAYAGQCAWRQFASLRSFNVNKEQLHADPGAGSSVSRAQLQVIIPESMHIAIRPGWRRNAEFGFALRNSNLVSFFSK